MTICTAWLPQPDDICFPRGRVHGVVVRIISIDADSMLFWRHDPGNEPYRVVNRLETFTRRFELA